MLYRRWGDLKAGFQPDGRTGVQEVVFEIAMVGSYWIPDRETARKSAAV